MSDIALPAGDRMTAVHGEHAPALMRFLLRLTNGDRQTAEDLLQETMLRAWRRVGSIPADPEGARRWLFTIARRLVIDRVRTHSARPREVGDLDLATLSAADDTTGSALAAHTVVLAFGSLSEAHRVILSAVYLSGDSVQEVAATLGVPVGTVKSRVHYAMQALRSGIDAGAW